MKYFLLFILITCISTAFSQWNDSVPSTLIPGIYETIEEFQSNNPSVRMKPEACLGTTYSQLVKNDYQLCMHTKMEGKIPPKIFGFCDGEAVYIAPVKNSLASHKSGFLKLENVNEYSCYYALKTEVIASFDMETTEEVATLMCLNVLDGTRKKLTGKLVRKIISDDDELHYYFNQERQKHDLMFFYLLQYYDRKLHPVPVKTEAEDELH